LLDDDAGLSRPHLAEALHDERERRRRRRAVVEAAALRPPLRVEVGELLVQVREAVRLVELTADVVQELGERLPLRLVERGPRELLDGLPRVRSKRIVVPVASRVADDREVLGDETLA